ncbi:ribosome biogenesis factor YjgA [Spongiibacter sp.]|uniref:ribosome biogenesis factor YjgA n=1 Tax=Spongiibacter sp. TaxID=2024860 RepID=UPI003563A7A8
MTDSEQERPSKTALKREMEALQKLGSKLVGLSSADLARIPIEDPDLREAIATARRIKSREGLRRQMQYIGKLMRLIDASAIEAALHEQEQGQKALARRFHELEDLRDQLLEKGPASTDEALKRFPNADRQRLRQLLMQANREKTANKPPAAARKLFRYLRELQQIANEEENSRGV